MTGRPIKIPKEQLEVDVAAGLSTREIAKKYNTSRNTLRLMFKELGLKSGRRCGSIRFSEGCSQRSKQLWQNPEFRAALSKINLFTREQLEADVANGLSIREISKKYRISRSTLYKRSRECGIELGRMLGRQVGITKEQLESDIAAGLSTRQMARKHEITRAALKLGLKRFGLKTNRKPGDDSQLVKKRWQDPKYRESLIRQLKIIASIPGYKEKMSAISKQRWQSPEYRTKQALARSLAPRTLTQPHRKVLSLLDFLGVFYKYEHPLGFYCYDVFIPSHNILIEVQGDYWHNLPKMISRDKSKSTYTQRYLPEYKLYYVWEHELKREEEVLKKMKVWLGLTEPDVKVGFTKERQYVTSC
jgi:transposase